MHSMFEVKKIKGTCFIENKNICDDMKRTLIFNRDIFLI